MTSNAEAAEIARRVVRAAETESVARLRKELGRAQRFEGRDEERLELVGAIAREMSATLASSPAPEIDLCGCLGPHLQLLRHLSHSTKWVN